MAGEQRRFSRIMFNVRASLETMGQVFEFDRITNLSVGGCMVETTMALPESLPGQEAVFKIFTDRTAPTVQVSGEIVRINDKEIGLKFTAIDPDDLYHLQNIIRYNAEDPDQIEKELNEHPGLK